MARNWKDVRAEAAASGKLDEQRVAQHRERAEGRIRAHKLAEVRAVYALPQTVIAERLGISQARVSKIECGQLGQARVSTLEAYAHALGGKLEVAVNVGGERIILT